MDIFLTLVVSLLVVSLLDDQVRFIRRLQGGRWVKIWRDKRWQGGRELWEYQEEYIPLADDIIIANENWH